MNSQASRIQAHSTGNTRSQDSSSNGSLLNSNPALLGAAKAFSKSKPPPPPKPTVLTQSGALKAAASSWASQSATNLSSPITKEDESKKAPSPLRSISRSPARSPEYAASAPVTPISSQPGISSIPLRNGSVVSVDDFPPRPPRPSRNMKPPPPLPPARDTKSRPTSVDFANSAAMLASRSPAIQTSALPAVAPNPNSARRNSKLYQNQSMQLLSPHVNASGLANAIVGASVSLSRNPSPYPSSNTGNLQLKSPSRLNQSRSVSPRKPGELKETLRKNGNDDNSDDVQNRGRTGRVRRHLNRHGEGDAQRKRLTETISEEEFKRYAGLWASNRGYLFTEKEQARTTDNLDEEVHNFIVRELWRRSHLPDDLLREVWDLVDLRGAPRLTKTSFIVGTWLIDQQLKGRKLPVKVEASVWESVGRLEGVNVRIRLK